MFGANAFFQQVFLLSQATARASAISASLHLRCWCRIKYFFLSAAWLAKLMRKIKFFVVDFF